ncbi:hypothetical protein [Inquilinus limosus]|uniref:Uncharacterized protein n=1 Tax=Inquilinus limosus MP06 TaxID=1398085 RepID=A0A0A0DB44_9PROT|nr:hypothetical protein [Inquilinus limosus]KGM35314.1 hypothetical protein P409_05220 [Inquilinus limosus MP06]
MTVIKHAVLANAVVVNDHVIPDLAPHETPEWLPEALYRRLEEFHAQGGEEAGLDLSDLGIRRDRGQFMAFRIEWNGRPIEGLAMPHLIPLSQLTLADLMPPAGTTFPNLLEDRA